MFVFLASTFATVKAQELDLDAMELALQAHERDVNHLLRDEIRKPIEVLKFVGIKPGMKVLDIYAADGYYSYVLSKAVKENGLVYAQNPPAGSDLEDIRQMYSLADALDERVVTAQLENLVHLRENFTQLSIPAGSLDAIFLVQILHDFYNGDAEFTQSLLSQLATLLKEDGFFVIIDHSGDNHQDNARLHRMEQRQAQDLLKRIGFAEQKESAILSNRRDQRRRPVFDPMLGRNTDRFLLKASR